MQEIDSLEKSRIPKFEINTESKATQATFAFDIATRNKVLQQFDQQSQQLENQLSRSLNVEKPKKNFSVGSLLANADILQKHDELELSKTLLREALNKDASNLLAVQRLVAILDKQRHFVESCQVAKASLKIEDSFNARVEVGHALYKLGRDAEAFEFYMQALDMLTDDGPALFEIYKNLGNIYVRDGDFDGAEEYYNKAYTLNTGSDSLLVNFGTLSAQKGDFNHAKDHFQRALEINPKSDKAWVGLALVHSHFGDHEIAWANLENALEINVTNRTAVHLAANWSVRDQMIDKGISFLMDFLATQDLDSEMSLALVHLLCLKGDYFKAFLETERVLCWNPALTQFIELQTEIQARLSPEESY